MTNIKSAKVTQLSKVQKIEHPGADIVIENEVATKSESVVLLFQ